MKNNPIVPNRNYNNYDMNSRKFYNNNIFQNRKSTILKLNHRFYN